MSGKKLPYSRKEAKVWGWKVLNGFIQDPITPFKADYSFDADGMEV